VFGSHCRPVGDIILSYDVKACELVEEGDGVGLVVGLDILGRACVGIGGKSDCWSALRYELFELDGRFLTIEFIA
jgi:hypothetical protein